MFGSGIVHNKSNINEILYNIITNPETKMTRMSEESRGGYIFTIDLLDTTILKSLTSRDFYNISNIILKIVVISGSSEDIYGEFRYKEEDSLREITTLDKFMNECNTQIFLHNMSYDNFLESICPTIIGHYCIDKNSKIMKCNTNNEIVNIIKYILEKNLQVGFIFMEKLNCMNVVSNLLSNYNQKQQMDSQIETDINDIISHNLHIKNVLDNYLYELIRLWRIGYTHGDTHLENALYNSPYPYIEGERVYLIDFGRTIKNKDYNRKKRYIRTDWELMKTKMTNMTKNTYTNEIHWSYKFLHYYNNKINTIEWYKNICEKRFKSKMDFLHNLTTTTTMNVKMPKYQSIINANNRFQYNLFDRDEIPPNVLISPEENFSSAYLTFSENENGLALIERPFVYENEKYSFSKIHNIDLFVYEIIQKLKIDRDYYNFELEFDDNFQMKNVEFLKNRMENMQNGTYTWMIYHKNNRLQISFFRTKCSLEIGTKHYCIMMKQQITYFYSAGEMLKKEGNQFVFNFLSSTFFMSCFTNEGNFNETYFIDVFKTSCEILNMIGLNVSFIDVVNYNNDTDIVSFITEDLPMIPDFFQWLLDNRKIVKNDGVKNGGFISLKNYPLNYPLKNNYMIQNEKTNEKINEKPKSKVNAKSTNNYVKVLQKYYENANIINTSSYEYDTINNKYNKLLTAFFVKHFRNEVFINNLYNIEKYIQTKQNNHLFGEPNFHFIPSNRSSNRITNRSSNRISNRIMNRSRTSNKSAIKRRKSMKNVKQSFFKSI
jgi:hypothetical protein